MTKGHNKGPNNPRWSGSRGDVNCKHCGVKFHVKPSAIKNGKGRVYCTKGCREKATKSSTKCCYCGREFSFPISRLRKGNVVYCSRKCLNKHRAKKNNRVCLVCNESFYVKKGELKRGDKKGIGSFCSMECKAKRMSKTQLTISGVNRNTAKQRRTRHPLGGLYVRSSWEANYARYLNWLVELGEIHHWEYEPDTFEFPVKRGSKFYTPDFKVWISEDRYEYHETKGWMDQVSKTKIKRMGIHYPDEPLIIIDSVAYRALAKDVKNLVPNWE